MRAILDHVEPLTEDIHMFWFKPTKHPNHIAGQFTELHLPHEKADERGHKRWFTISSSPSEDLLAITTRFTPSSSSSFKHALSELKPGSEVNLAEPMGDFVLPKDPAIPLVFVAGGIGITPMRSMIKWLIDSGERRAVHLIHGVRSPKDHVFRDLFDQYGVKTDVVMDGLSAKAILELIGKPEGKLVYLSGPEAMVETLFKELQKAGVNQKQLIGDYFPGYTAL